MAIPYCRGVLRIAVAQICQNLGWNSTQYTPLELLTDVMERYVQELGDISHRYCNQFGRTEVNLDDIGLAFQQMGVSIEELTEFISHVEPIPFAKETVAFPAQKKDNLQFPNPRSREILQHREEHIPEYLPHMFPGGKDDVDEPLSSEVVGLAPEFASPTNVSPNVTESKSTTNSTDGPPIKRPRITSASLPPEADPSQYEMMSVTMTQEGELTPKRQGKLPDTRTPPTGYKQALFRDPQPSPSEQIKEKVKEKYSESEKEKSDVDILYDSDNKSNNNPGVKQSASPKLSTKDPVKKMKSKSKLEKNLLKKSISSSKKKDAGILLDKKKGTEDLKKKKLGKDLKITKDGKVIRINKDKVKKKVSKSTKDSKSSKVSKEIPSEPVDNVAAKSDIEENFLNLQDPYDSPNSRGDSPERLVIASESDMKQKQMSARLAAVDDCIDEVIRQSVAEADQNVFQPTAESVEKPEEKSSIKRLDSMDETINSVIRQSSEDNDTSSVEIKLEIDCQPSAQKSPVSSAIPTTSGDDKIKKKSKLKDGKTKTSKEKGVRDKLKKKLATKNQKSEAKKPVIPALPDKYLTDEMKVFAFSDSPEHVSVPEMKKEPIEPVVEEPKPPSPVVNVKVEKEQVNPDNNIKQEAVEPTDTTNISKEIVPTPSTAVQVSKPVTQAEGELKSKDKHHSKEHKKDKKDKKDKDKKKKKKKDKDKDREREKDKKGEVKDDKEKKEKKKDKSKSEKERTKEKKSNELREESPSTPTFPRLKLNIKLGGTPISSTSLVGSPSLSEAPIGSPKLEPGTPSRPPIGSPSRPEIPKLVIKPLTKQVEEQKQREEKQKMKEEKQKLKEEKQKLKEEKRLKEEKELEKQREIEKEKEREREKEKEREKELELERERKRKKEEEQKELERQREIELKMKKELELKLQREAEQELQRKEKQEEELKEKQRKEKESLMKSKKLAKAAKKLLKKQLTEPLPPKVLSQTIKSRSPTPPTVPASPASSNHSSPSRSNRSPPSSPIQSPSKSPCTSPLPPPKPSPTTPVKTPSRGRGRPPKNKNSPKVLKPSPRRYSPRTKSPESPNRGVKAGTPVSPASDDIVLDSSSGVVAETVGTFVDASGNQIWICPACKMQDDGSPMIGCDGCPDWYHWVCVNIVQEPPEDEEWFCPRCRQTKKSKTKIKRKRKKKV